MLSRVLQTRTPKPVGPGSPGVMAGAPFELFYEPDYLLPHRRAAFLLTSERLAETASFAGQPSDAVALLSPIADALSRLSDQLGATARSLDEEAGQQA